MEMRDYVMGHLHLKGVLRFAGNVCGLQFVILPGTILLQELFACSWDTLQQV